MIYWTNFWWWKNECQRETPSRRRQWLSEGTPSSTIIIFWQDTLLHRISEMGNQAAGRGWNTEGRSACGPLIGGKGIDEYNAIAADAGDISNVNAGTQPGASNIGGSGHVCTRFPSHPKNTDMDSRMRRLTNNHRDMPQPVEIKVPWNPLTNQNLTMFRNFGRKQWQR